MRIVKYIIVGFILLSFWENLIAQKSNVFIEYQYLELTNSQRNLDVIKDNYRNAELVSDSIINNQDENYINAHFYYELANAYKIGDEYGMWAFSLLRQLILFPNDSLRNGGIQSFVEACTKLKIDKSKAVSIYKQGAKGPNTKSFTAKLELLIEQSIELYDKDVEKLLQQYVFQYKKNSSVTSLKIKQWEYLNAIGLDIKNKKELMNNYYTATSTSIFNNNPKLEKKVNKKVIKYEKNSDSLTSFTKLFEKRK
jgi:hypothetical protein